MYICFQSLEYVLIHFVVDIRIKTLYFLSMNLYTHPFVSFMELTKLICRN